MEAIILTVLNGANENRNVTVLHTKRMKVGRGATADLAIVDLWMSREHFLVTGDQTSWRIRDLQSRHGTLVNGTRIEDIVLQEGDIITAGDTEFLVSFVPAQSRQDSAESARSRNDQQAMNQQTWTK